MKYFFVIGISLGLIWCVALFVGVCSQLKQAVKHSLDGVQAPIESNPVLTGTLRILGLSRRDRLTCSIFIFNALMLWPITLIVAVPLINAFRTKERSHVEKGQETQHATMFLQPDRSMLHVPNMQTNINQAVSS